MTPDILRAELDRLTLTQAKAARLFGCTDRTLRRWLAGDIEIPRAVALLVVRLKPSEATTLAEHRLMRIDE